MRLSLGWIGAEAGQIAATSRRAILTLRLPVVASRRWLSSKVATCAMRGLELN